MRISDWSSDVCSSDLYEYGTDYGYLDVAQGGSTCTMDNSVVKTVNLNHGTSGSTAFSYSCPRNTVKSINGAYSPLNDAHYFGKVIFDMYDDYVGSSPLTFQLTMKVQDRKSVVEGKRVSVRVDPGGRRTIKQKTQKHPKRW